MFYVVGTKVYSAVYNEQKKCYPEVKLLRNPEGHILFKSMPTGAAQKPAGRTLCTREEVLAQLGATVPEYIAPEKTVAKKK